MGILEKHANAGMIAMVPVARHMVFVMQSQASVFAIEDTLDLIAKQRSNAQALKYKII